MSPKMIRNIACVKQTKYSKNNNKEKEKQAENKKDNYKLDI